jgi:hypothetical protein
MAMTKCKECKAEVSTKADKCPHCGVKNPGKKTSTALQILLILLLLGFIGSFFSGPDTASNDTSKQAPKQPEKTAQQLAKEEANCKKYLQCWGDKNNLSATVYCKKYVERLAKFSFEWTDGMLEPKFSHFRWKDVKAGVVTYIGDKIKFQNGFGAWQNYVYECDFDPKTNQVVDVRANPGML